MITQECRPKLFREVSGQNLPKTVLKAICKSPATSPRTIILEGEYGTGKTTCARIFAKALNCKYKLKDGDACGKCEDCQSDISNSIYYEEYDSSIIGNITDIKELKETFYFNESLGYKVIVLDEAHLITPQAQSALLKLFEESPAGIFFVLCTTNSSKILNTIRSRALTLKFDLLSQKEIEDNLENIAKNYLQIDIDNDIIKLVAERSKGHLRNAHMLLEQYQMLGREEFISLYRSCTELYGMFIRAIICKRSDILSEIIEKLLHYRLSELKSEYELFVLNIIKLFYNENASDDKQMIFIVSYFKHKKNNFIDILNDYRNYDMFNSDIRFTSFMWLLADRLKQLTK
ncbi:MAG: AAA family ATPase [Bacilli bacterium]|nr:AAA family ATPase [Bacilli bacterium]MBQ3307573.1 AAA family ATPase [Bacilli bacterium]